MGRRPLWAGRRPAASRPRAAISLSAYSTSTVTPNSALGQKLGEALIAEKVAAEASATAAAKTPRPGGPAEAMRAAAAGAARLIAAPDGPRIAALAFDGFDTHFNEGAAQGYLAQRLQGLDGAFDALEMNLGEAWKDSVVVAITEFGRTARVNGTHGTDHGTATVALLAGGALAGGRVIADWPSSSPEACMKAGIFTPLPICVAC